MFTVWHHLCRIGLPVLLVVAGLGFVLPRDSGLLVLPISAAVVVALLALTSVLLTLALFCGFRFRCPQCGGKHTSFGMHQKRLWLNCHDCGLTEETGFLKLQLKFTPKAELDHD
jgi:hypothetical protein